MTPAWGCKRSFSSDVVTTVDTNKQSWFRLPYILKIACSVGIDVHKVCKTLTLGVQWWTGKKVRSMVDNSYGWPTGRALACKNLLSYNPSFSFGDLSQIFTWPLVGVWNIVISVSVCLFVCSHSLKTTCTFKFHQIFCTYYPWPWLGASLTIVQYVMYFWFRGDVTFLHNRVKWLKSKSTHMFGPVH